MAENGNDLIEENVENLPGSLSETHEHYRTRVFVTVPQISSSNNNDGPVYAKEVDSSPIKTRYVRRRVSVAERQFIWESTNGRCYLCKELLPLKSSWHIEHVVAFSSNPQENDVLGNMLPSCAACNLRKNSKDLLVCIANDPTFDLGTFAKDVKHLNTAARNKLLVALELKRSNQNKDKAKKDQEISESEVKSALCEIEEHLHRSISEAEALENSISSSDDHDFRCQYISKEMLEDFDEGSSGSIGYGTFGQVYVASLRFQKSDSSWDVKPCAIKMISCRNKSSMNSFQREVKILAMMKHPNIVSLFGWCGTPSARLGIVMEYCSYSLNEPRVKISIYPMSFFAQLANALSFLHEQGCVHRDIKPNNILVSKTSDQPWSTAVAKLCDFGVAKFTMFAQSSDGHTKNAGTAGFRPPEMRRGVLTSPSDIYSLGKTMLEIRNDNNQLMSNRDLLISFDSMIEEMTKYRPEQRVSAKELAEKFERILSGKLEPLVSSTKSTKVKKELVTSSQEPAIPSIFNNPASPLSKDFSRGAEPSCPSSNSTMTGTVHISPNTRCSSNPSGRKGSYHSSSQCRYFKESTVEISEDEAIKFGNSLCKICAKTVPVNNLDNVEASSSPSRSSSNSSTFVQGDVSQRSPLNSSSLGMDKCLSPSGFPSPSSSPSRILGPSSSPARSLLSSPVSVSTESPLKSQSNTQEKLVFLVKTSAYRENPRGRPGAKYHCVESCDSLINSVSGVITVPLEEAISFRHTLCAKCAKLMNVNPIGVDEITKDLSKASL